MAVSKSTASKTVSISNDQAKATIKALETIDKTKATKSTASKAKTTTKAKATTAKAKPKATTNAEPIAQAIPGRIERIDTDILDPCESLSQLRDRFSQETLDRYTDLMRNDLWDWTRTESFPVLFKDDRGQYHFGDGHHTVEAAQNANVKQIDCHVKDGDLNDAIEYSYSRANRLHGLPITNSGKQKLVIETIKNTEMLSRISLSLCKGTNKDVPSSRAIAQWLNIVSAVYVGNIWDKLIMNNMGTDHPWLLATKRIGLDGKRSKVTPPTPAPEPIASPKADTQAQPKAPAPEPMVNAAAAPADQAIDKEYGEPELNAHNAIVIMPQVEAPTDDTAPSEAISSHPAKLQIEGLSKHYADRIIKEVSRYEDFNESELSQALENIQRAIVEQLIAILK